MVMFNVRMRFPILNDRVTVSQLEAEAWVEALAIGACIAETLPRGFEVALDEDGDSLIATATVTDPQGVGELDLTRYIEGRAAMPDYARHSQRLGLPVITITPRRE